MEPRRADLVLEGGGVKGLGLVGAISVLKEEGFAFPRVAGTSAGAIVGAFVAALERSGHGFDRLERLMRELPYADLADGSRLVLGFGPLAYLTLLVRKGLHPGGVLREWVAAGLRELGVETFADLRQDDPGSALPPAMRYRLVVIVADVSRGALVRLPWDYPRYGLDPDRQRVADAVRASAAIPFFFTPERLPPGPPLSRRRSYIVDGGLLSNFPVDVFDRDRGRPRWPTFGVKLSARRRPDVERFTIGGTLGLARGLIGTMLNAHDQMHLDDPCIQRRTVFVDTSGVAATDFALGRDAREGLYANGRRAARRFLDGWDEAAYLRECRAAETGDRGGGPRATTEAPGNPVPRPHQTKGARP